MKVRRSIVATGAAVVLGTAGALVPALASASSATHTLKFTAVQVKSVAFTKTTGANQETDLNAAGKTIGFDMIYFKFASAGTAAVNITVDTKGGFLYGTAAVGKTGAVTNGKVTGGTGAFKGATGTLKAKALNKAGTRHAVTITYSG